MENKPTNEIKSNTFSKSIMSTIVFLYLTGALIGGVLVIVSAFVDIRLQVPIDTSMFMAYAAYLGGPTATAIGFYAWKSKAENVLKIGQSFKSEAVSDVVRILSEMEEN